MLIDPPLGKWHELHAHGWKRQSLAHILVLEFRKLIENCPRNDDISETCLFLLLPDFVTNIFCEKSYPGWPALHCTLGFLSLPCWSLVHMMMLMTNLSAPET